MKLHSAALLLIFPVLAATSAYAVDGVMEINQTCATQLGCFSGDAVSYPITIDGTAGRSYRLTSDLIVPDENTDGIDISSPSISIDLNGFEIVRSGCEGATTDCTPDSGTGSGVRVPNSSYFGVSIRNGSVVGMGEYGVYLQSSQSEAVGLRVRWSRYHGIVAGNASTMRDNIAYGNGWDGISVGTGCTVSGNTAYDNGTDGIDAGAGSTASGNTAYGNDDNGIEAGSGSTVSGNTAYDNGGDGIDAGAGSTVQRNAVRGNTGFGLDLSSDAAYRENVITNNTAGTVDGGLNMYSNSCNGTTTCP